MRKHTYAFHQTQGLLHARLVFSHRATPHPILKLSRWKCQVDVARFTIIVRGLISQGKFSIYNTAVAFQGSHVTSLLPLRRGLFFGLLSLVLVLSSDVQLRSTGCELRGQRHPSCFHYGPQN